MLAILAKRLTRFAVCLLSQCIGVTWQLNLQQPVRCTLQFMSSALSLFCTPTSSLPFNRGSPVRCLAASPALDVIGVGLADGRAILHNLRYDEQVMVLHNAAAAGTGAGRFLQGTAAANAAAASSAAVTCLSFRTGGQVTLLGSGHVMQQLCGGFCNATA
jgi:hypothetical protein